MARYTVFMKNLNFNTTHKTESNLMLCVPKIHILNNRHFSRWIRLQLDNIWGRIMSSHATSTKDTDEVQKGNKRPLTDENIQDTTKIQKVEPTKKLKSKKYALMLCYLGKEYYGMQRNPGMKTVEEELLSALLKANYITQDGYESLREISFQRAARTDKRVSALRQVVSVKLSGDVERSQINQYLPDDIRVFGVKRVTKSFNSKITCDARTYRYVVPTYVFAPEEDPTSLRKEDDDFNMEIDITKRSEQLSTINGKPFQEFRISTEDIDRLNSVLKLFEGTHNFHNFTSKVKPLDPRATRYIIYFRHIETFVSKNMEYAVLEIKGQSFMLHQIRKMVALTIIILRNIYTEDIINEAFQLERMDIPIAPGLGLMLNSLHYDYYNKRYGSDGIHENLDWSECDDEVKKFTEEYILKYIVDTEISEKVGLQWIAKLAYHHLKY